MNMDSHFYGMPTRSDYGNSVMVMGDTHKTTFDAGKLVPIFVYSDCLPGETYEIDPAFLLRSLTPLHPVLDDAVLDLFCFYVPHRVEYDKFENLMGAYPEGYGVDPNTYSIPQIYSGTNGFLPGSVADYFRIPTKVGGLSVSAIPFRMYVHIYNEWFRKHDIQAPGSRPTNGIAATTVTTLGDPVTEAYKGGALFNVARLPDYFSTVTPAPQRSTSQVTLALPDVPVFDIAPADGKIDAPTVFNPRVYGKSGTSAVPVDGEYLGTRTASGGADPSGRLGHMESVSGDPSAAYLSLAAKTSAASIAVNDFRWMVQLQKLYERDTFSGGVYKSIIQAHFGTSINDGRLQRPELYGWQRYRINQQQVAQTSDSSETSPLGNMGAYSLTVSGGRRWRIPSPEWGTIMVLACIRVKRTYQQALLPMWTRKTRLDHYWRVFSHIGNTPVYKRSICATGTSTDNEVFGYQEAWADYRQLVPGVSGLFRTNTGSGFDTWHYADYYESVPSFSSDWVKEGSAEIGRTLAVEADEGEPAYNQFFGIFAFKVKKTTPVSLYSVPGLVDHF